MRIDRVWAMPNRWTFTILPIKRLLEEEGVGCGNWCDPFAGAHSPAQVTNDLNPKMPTDCHKDALVFLREQPSATFDGVLFDPPYSISQAKECYDAYGTEYLNISVTSMAYWARCKGELARIVTLNGKALCFGWSSMGLGKSRHFEMTRILLVPHGGSKNDTICTVEVKTKT